MKRVFSDIEVQEIVLNIDEVCSIIRDVNIVSQHVAVRNGMTVKDNWTKYYRGFKG